MRVPLFIDTRLPEVEKLAFEAKLSDNSDTWTREILDELLKQHPYLGAYELTPVMTAVDGDRGMGIGYVQVSSPTATQSFGPGGEALRALQGVRFIRVNVIVRDLKLCPLDIFMAYDNQEEGRPYPLNERRVREALYRPSLFDGVQTAPGDRSLVSDLYPPTNRQRGMAGGQIVDQPQTKLSSDRSVLRTIAPTILRGDLERVSGALEKDSSLARALVHNPATLSALDLLRKVEPITAEDVTKVASDRVRHDVLQVARIGDVYRLKLASSQSFEPETVEADRPTMVELAGKDLVTQADKQGVVTVTTDPVVRDVLEDEEVKPIDRFGEYRVKTPDGKELMGWVFPTVLDYDGTSLPMSLFTNGSQSAIQGSIVGSLVGKGTNMLRGKPQGYGFFYRVTAEGSVLAFLPVNIKAPQMTEGHPSLMGTTMLGNPVQLRFDPMAQGPSETSPGEYTLPIDVRWAPLADLPVKLMENAEDFAKMATLKNLSAAVEVLSDGSTWSFRGGAGLSKLARDQRELLGGEDAMFLACSLGMSPLVAATVMQKAAQDWTHSVNVNGCRELTLRKEKVAMARRASGHLWSQLPARPLLLKEAAALEDVTTVDHVLSLGFLNPENIQLFIEFLPDFDETVSNLATLLVAARTGGKDLPEGSVKSAMERLEEVIDGLRRMVYRSDEGDKLSS